MKIHGWCTRCSKVKRVTVTNGAIMRAHARRSAVIVGVCDACNAPYNPRRHGSEGHADAVTGDRNYLRP